MSVTLVSELESVQRRFTKRLPIFNLVTYTMIVVLAAAVSQQWRRPCSLQRASWPAVYILNKVFDSDIAISKFCYCCRGVCRKNSRGGSSGVAGRKPLVAIILSIPSHMFCTRLTKI